MFVDNSALRFFRTFDRLEPWLSFIRTTRVLDNPCIVMQLWNGAKALHVFDLELSTEDLELILHHVSNIVEFTYINRFHSNEVRDFLSPSSKHTYPEKLLIDFTNAATNRPDMKGRTYRGQTKM